MFDIIFIYWVVILMYSYPLLSPSIGKQEMNLLTFSSFGEFCQKEITAVASLYQHHVNAVILLHAETTIGVK